MRSQLFSLMTFVMVGAIIFLGNAGEANAVALKTEQNDKVIRYNFVEKKKKKRGAKASAKKPKAKPKAKEEAEGEGDEGEAVDNLSLENSN